MLPTCFLSVKKCCFPHLASDVRNSFLIKSRLGPHQALCFVSVSTPLLLSASLLLRN